MQPKMFSTWKGTKGCGNGNWGSEPHFEEFERDERDRLDAIAAGEGEHAQVLQPGDALQTAIGEQGIVGEVELLEVRARGAEEGDVWNERK
jgi:hypothetical protein